jgi:hypothetical protein
MRHMPSESAPGEKVAPHLVVVLKSKQEGEKKGEDTWLHIEGYEFTPAVIPLTAESTLVFKNHDDHPYSCFAEGPNAFQFNELKPGQTHEQRLLSEGALEVRCHKYPFMRTTVVVVDGEMVTTTDDSGLFLFNKVPSGQYQVKVLVEGKAKFTRDVQVPDTGVVRVSMGETPEEPAADEATGTAPPVQEKTPVPAEKAPAAKPVPAKKPPVKRPPRKPPTKKPPVTKPAETEPTEPVFKDVEPEIEIEED